MEYGIVSSGVRRGVNGNPSMEREAKVLKLSDFDGGVSVRDSEKSRRGEPQEAANYALRDNPKKTKRFASKELRVCKECGKGFQSLKALCGHMASHSDKERPSNSKLKEEKPVMDGHSDTESSGPKRMRTSKRFICKSFGAQREQEEVAISLMLLSRDCGHSVVAESSSNDSVVLEPKSSSLDTIIGARKTANNLELAVAEKIMIPKPSGSENSDSGYFRNGPKKAESDISINGLKLEVESGSGFLVEKNLVDKEGKDQEKRSSSKYELRKRRRSGIYRTEAVLSYFREEADYVSNDETETEQPCRNAQKRSKYECLTCKKTFHSHTALGGHRASHAKTNGCSESVCESGEISTETRDHTAKLLAPPNAPAKSRSGSAASKKSKGHECPICFRMFKSGQALGGHKRSHFVGGREASNPNLTKPEPETALLFDLNLPAPMEEEGIQW